jgi:hypothetical protein
MNKAEICSIWTNFIVLAERVSVIYFVKCGNLANVENIFGPLRFHFVQVLLYNTALINSSFISSYTVVL